MPWSGADKIAEVERTLRTIFKRCVQCPDVTPTCPTCKDGQICSLVPLDCNTCPYMTCIANPSPAPKSQGPNVGAIAGGVVGGVAAVALIVFLVWRFWIKKRREQQEMELVEDWEGDEIAQQKAVHQLSAMHTDAVSTRTRGSLANSILSRASNIIQIAYIPGVTNRNGGSGHNSLLGVAPMPPVPAATRGSQPPKSPLSNEGDALFFRPGDLRDSSYSATSSFNSATNNRDTQYTRQSITPSLARSSVVSEIYRDDASEMPMPATTVMRAAPRMVSVKSSGSPNESIGSKTPTSVSEDSHFNANTPTGNGIQVLMPGQFERPSTASSQQSNQSQYVKAKQVTVGGRGRFPVRQASDASTSASTISRHAPAISSPLADMDDSDEDEDEHSRARQSMLHASQGTSTPPITQPVESPFFDASERLPGSSSSRRAANPYATMGSSIGDNRPKRGDRSIGVLSAVIEEATKRASRAVSHEGLGGKWDVSPFGDEHATK